MCLQKNKKSSWKLLLKKDFLHIYLPSIMIIIFIYICQFNQIMLCPFQYFLSLPCPFCGITRASLLFITGQWIEVWKMNSCFYAFIIGILLTLYYRYKKQKEKPIFILWICILSLFLMNYIYGMLIKYPYIEPYVPQ